MDYCTAICDKNALDSYLKVTGHLSFDITHNGILVLANVIPDFVMTTHPTSRKKRDNQ